MLANFISMLEIDAVKLTAVENFRDNSGLQKKVHIGENRKQCRNLTLQKTTQCDD